MKKILLKYLVFDEQICKNKEIHLKEIYLKEFISKKLILKNILKMIRTSNTIITKFYNLLLHYIDDSDSFPSDLALYSKYFKKRKYVLRSHEDSWERYQLLY